MHHKSDGFTLVEVLVSLFIFSLISVGAMSALFSTLQSSDRLEDTDEDLHALTRMRAVLRADFDAVILRENRDALGGAEPLLITTDGDPLITFTRDGVPNPGGILPRGSIQRVSYIFRDGQLIRRTLPHENPSQSSEWRERIVIDGLRNASLDLLTYSNAQTFTLPNWRLRRGETLDPKSVPRLALKLTDKAGETTTHLFELAL